MSHTLSLNLNPVEVLGGRFLLFLLGGVFYFAAENAEAARTEARQCGVAAADVLQIYWPCRNRHWFLPDDFESGDALEGQIFDYAAENDWDAFYVPLCPLSETVAVEKE